MATADEHTIFLEAVDKQAADERSAFLDAACGGDAKLRARVDELVAAHERAGSFLESPPPGVTLIPDDGGGVAPAPAPVAERAGTSLGPYRLIEQIGEGGMGVVFMAEQLRPVRRKVALKIVKPGLDTKEVIARFGAERQALAMMDHPNIAKVFDAGSTDTGRPYFVMELVRGVPITQYCDEQKLAPRERLELFAQVCHAVQHAHTKGVIHRDLKPTNVLVTLNDGDRPVPKVIDFGIAKATAGQRLTEQTLFTEFRQLVGTPLYMSPEQAEMSTLLDVDTRSDVYSLGVLLYELLTGTTPFDRQRLAKAAHDEVRRIVREEEPPRPSTRLSTMLGATLTSVSAQRHTDPKKLGGIVRGELDWIVMRALEKDRARRYETANGLAKDVERYLADEPVQACPPSRTYRLRKFARRNKAAMATATFMAAVLVLATAVSTWQAIRATRAERQVARERDQATAEKMRANEQAAIAKAVNDFLNQDVLGQASVYNQHSRETAPQHDLKVRDALDQAAERIAGRFDKQPLVEAAIRYTIGDAYADLGEYQKGEQHLEEALRLRRQSLDDSHPDVRQCLRALALTYLLHDQFPKAERLLRQGVRVQRETLGAEHPDTLRAMSDLAALYIEKGDYAEAEPLLRQALDGQQRVLGEQDRETIRTMTSLGNLYLLKGQYADAESLALKTLDARSQMFGDQHPITLISLQQLAGLYKDQRRFDEAERRLLQVSQGLRKVHGEQHPLVLHAADLLAWVYDEQGNHDKAQSVLLQALAGLREVHDEQHPLVLTALSNLARSYQRQEKYDQAKPLLLQALEGMRKARGEQHVDTLSAMHNLGALYYEQGQFSEAEALLVPALEGRRKILGERHRDTSRTINYLAAVYDVRGNHDKAEALLLNALEERRKVFSETHHDIVEMINLLGGTYARAHKYAEAEPLLQQAWGSRRKVYGEQHPDTLNSLTNLARMYQNQGRYDLAEPLYLQLLEAQRKGLGEQHPDTLLTLQHLGTVYSNQDLDDKAEPFFRLALVGNRKVHGDQHYETVRSMSSLGQIYAVLHQFDKAQPLLEQALDGWRKIKGERNRETLDTMSKLASMYARQGRYDKAEPLFLTALQGQREVLGDDDRETLITLHNFGDLYFKQGIYEKAKPLFLEARAGFGKIFGDQHRNTLECVYALGQVYAAQREFSQAEPLLRQALKLRRELFGEENGEVGANLGRLSDVLLAQGKTAASEALWRERVDYWQKKLETADKPSRRAEIHLRMFGSLMKTGEVEQAKESCRKALELKALNVASAPMLSRHAWELATSTDSAHREPALAVKLAEAAVELAPQNEGIWNILGVAHYRAGDIPRAVADLEKSRHIRSGGDSFDFFFLAMAHQRLGDAEAARQWYEKGVQWMDQRAPHNEQLRRFRAEAEETLTLTSSARASTRSSGASPGEPLVGRATSPATAPEPTSQPQ